MLLTETNKTQPAGLGQPFPFISGHQNPSGSFENLGCWRCPPSRLHWRTELPKQALLLRAEVFSAGRTRPTLLLFLTSSDQGG